MEEDMDIFEEFISSITDAEYTIRQSADGSWWLDVSHYNREKENYRFSSREGAHSFMRSIEPGELIPVESEDKE